MPKKSKFSFASMINFERIKRRRLELHLTQEHVAQRVKVSRTAIQQWERGIVNPKSNHLEVLAEVLNCSPEWLLKGEGVIQPTRKNFEASLDGAEEIRWVPLISAVQAGQWADLPPDYSVDEFTEWVPASKARTSTRSFAMRVQGESMISSNGRRVSLHPGYKVIVDPEAREDEGAIVVAIRAGTVGSEATIKRYARDGDQFMLVPNNTQYQALDGKDSRIIGVVRQVVIDL